MIDNTEKQKVSQVILENPNIGVRELCNRSFFFFLQRFWSSVSSATFKPNWHIKYLCDVLQDLAEWRANKNPKKYDLIINVPPGMTKTITCSIMFPVWCWTRWHWMMFIAASYSNDLSLESAGKSRDVIYSSQFRTIYPELKVREDKDARGNFQIVNTTEPLVLGGTRYTTSVKSTLTGFHGDILIVDDPLNPKRAASDAEIKEANDWFEQTLPTRKTDKEATPTILIMQRLHQNDPTGHILNKDLNIRHICLPGEINNKGYDDKVKPPELKTFYVDGLLDSNRLTSVALKELMEKLGQYGYASQIGQNPTPPSGGMFQIDKIITIERPPDLSEISHIIRAWDKAGTVPTKKGQEPAWTVGLKMARLKIGKVVILDIKRGRWSSDVREEIIKQTAQADGSKVEIWIEQEPGSGGKESAENTVRNLMGFSVRVDRPTGDKLFRADPFSVQVNAGNVLILNAVWNTDFKEELRFCPFGRFMDQIDAASLAFSKLSRKKQVWVL